MFTDKPKLNCHRTIILITSYNAGTSILRCTCILWSDIWSYRENLIALGGESWISCREPRSGNCVPVYQWTHCIINFHDCFHSDYYHNFILPSSLFCFIDWRCGSYSLSKLSCTASTISKLWGYLMRPFQPLWPWNEFDDMWNLKVNGRGLSQ